MALVMRGAIEEGQSILIHAGAGGVGQAAIHVALSFNCKVFTTVGSRDKRAFITKTFPQVCSNLILAPKRIYYIFEPLTYRFQPSRLGAVEIRRLKK